MQMITDRTEADVLLENEKGTYGYTDLNRVEEAVAEIAAMLPPLGITIVLEPKTDWGLPGDFSADTFPVASQMERYLGNIRRIQEKFAQDVPFPATMEDLTWLGANNIEKAVETAAWRLSMIPKIYRYSGEIYAGEEFGL